MQAYKKAKNAANAYQNGSKNFFAFTKESGSQKQQSGGTETNNPFGAMQGTRPSANFVGGTISTNVGQVSQTPQYTYQPTDNTPSYQPPQATTSQPISTPSPAPSVEPGSGTGAVGSTGYQPFTLDNYTPLGASNAQKQEMYISNGGKSFFGAAQFKPTNPFTGKEYDLDANGLPKYEGMNYGPGTFLPGQLRPTS